MALGDDNRAWESRIVVDATGQQAVSHTTLAADMEDKRGLAVAPAVGCCWRSEAVALQDSAPVMRRWGSEC